MCLIAFAVDGHPRYPLVLVANRDERYARATAPAAEWEDHPGLVAGRDLEGGGTWLGARRGGRFAALTNYHGAPPPRSDAPTRGELVTGFLVGELSPGEYLERLLPLAGDYNGFNLVVGVGSEVHWFSNRSEAGPTRLDPGVYGLSNHLLDTPWPKVERAKRLLTGVLREDGGAIAEPLLDLLHDRELPDPAAHPGLAPHERAFAASFIVTPEYGTRATSVLLLERDGGGLLAERTHERGSLAYTEVRHTF